MAPKALMAPRHFLDLDRIDAATLRRIVDMGHAMKRAGKRVPAELKPEGIADAVLMLIFEKPSTRTRVSFELAAKRLGADVVNVAASTSSVVKGESLLDTADTLRALGADILVMRHAEAGAPHLVARRIDCQVINAGDGWHAHPTQALLDLYTVRERLGEIAGRRLTIVGDVLHSRVARSAIWGFGKLGACVTLCGPPTLLPAAPWSRRWAAAASGPIWATT